MLWGSRAILYTMDIQDNWGIILHAFETGGCSALATPTTEYAGPVHYHLVIITEISTKQNVYPQSSNLVAFYVEYLQCINV